MSVRLCPKCYQPAPVTERFCGKCGASLTMPTRSVPEELTETVFGLEASSVPKPAVVGVLIAIILLSLATVGLAHYGKGNPIAGAARLVGLADIHQPNPVVSRDNRRTPAPTTPPPIAASPTENYEVTRGPSTATLGRPDADVENGNIRRPPTPAEEFMMNHSVAFSLQGLGSTDTAELLPDQDVETFRVLYWNFTVTNTSAKPSPGCVFRLVAIPKYLRPYKDTQDWWDQNTWRQLFGPGIKVPRLIPGNSCEIKSHNGMHNDLEILATTPDDTDLKIEAQVIYKGETIRYFSTPFKVYNSLK